MDGTADPASPHHCKAPWTARRIARLQVSAIGEMMELGDQLGAISLAQGLPELDPPPEVLASAVAAIEAGDNGYTFPLGTLAFREAIAAKSAAYNRLVADPGEEVTVTCGVSEAVMATVLALTNPGDEVVILEPWYENYVPACRLAGARPRFVALPAPEYTFDPAELRAAFNSRTRLVLLNTPHNPTGRVFSRAELATIASLCQEFDVVAVADEIYEHFVYDGLEHISIGSLEGMHDRTVTISGLGKSYAVTGWRVGWVVAAAPLTALIRKVHEYLTICAPAPFQAAGITALALPAAYYEHLRQQLAARRRILLDGLDEIGMSYRRPEGAYYVMADFSGLAWPRAAWRRPDWSLSRAFAQYMAYEIGVVVVPGSSFYVGSEGSLSQVRMNFARGESTMREAVQRMRKLRRS